MAKNQREITVEKTRPADTTAYANEDVWSENTSTGTAWTFSRVTLFNAQTGFITKALIQCDDTNITPTFTMYLFNVTPTGNLNDNVANTNPVYATESDNYIGRLDWGAMEDLGGASEAEIVPGDTGMPKPFICAASDNTLYGVLVIRTGAYTPTNGAKIRVTLTIAPD